MQKDRLYLSGLVQGAIFADTHGNRAVMDQVLASGEKFDFMVHLGDGVFDGCEVAQETGMRFYGISGNWDRSSYPGMRVLTINSSSFLLLHGETIDIHPSLPKELKDSLIHKLSDLAEGVKAQAVLYGHSHHPDLYAVENRIFCNPGNHLLGSTTLPTYAKLSVNGNEGFSIALMRKTESGEWFEESVQVYTHEK